MNIQSRERKRSPVRNIRSKQAVSCGVNIKDFQKRIRPNPQLIKQLIGDIFLNENRGLFEVTIVLVDDSRIKKLNKQYLDRDYPTDVLAFPMQKENPPDMDSVLVGDIVISTQTAVRNSRQYATSSQEEFFLYLIHGLLHLLGYRDDNKNRRLAMQKRQQFYLTRFKARLELK